MIMTKKNKLRKSNIKRKCILIVIEAKIREGAEEEIEMRMMPIKTMEIMIKSKRLKEEEDKKEEIKEEIEEVKMVEIDKSLIITNSIVKKNIMIQTNRNHKDKIKMATSKGKYLIKMSMRMVTEMEIARNMRVIENNLITIKKRGTSLIKITIINKMMAKDNSSTNKRLKSNRKILKKKNKKKQMLRRKVNRKKNPKKFLIYNSNFKNTNSK